MYTTHTKRYLPEGLIGHKAELDVLHKIQQTKLIINNANVIQFLYGLI